MGLMETSLGRLEQYITKRSEGRAQALSIRRWLSSERRPRLKQLQTVWRAHIHLSNYN